MRVDIHSAALRMLHNTIAKSWGRHRQSKGEAQLRITKYRLGSWRRRQSQVSSGLKSSSRYALGH